MTPPFSGTAMFPLQAAVCSAVDPTTQLTIARRLLDLGADPNQAWRALSGLLHTPLSRAVALRNLTLAELLVSRGAGEAGWCACFW